MTVLFYTVLHLVQAHAWQFGDWQPVDHDDRRKYLEDSRLSAVKRDYARLSERSRDTRYELWTVRAEELADWEDTEFGRILGVLRRNGIDLHANLSSESNAEGAA